MPYYADAPRPDRDRRAASSCCTRTGTRSGARPRASWRDADVAMVTSYLPGRRRRRPSWSSTRRAPLRVFYDLDTPVTLARLASRRAAAAISARAASRDFDLVLSYTGGAALDRSADQARRAPGRAALRQRRSRTIHRPIAARPAFAADLSYLGTYAADRQAALEALFVEPARRRPERRFLIGGAQYPEDFPWTENIFFVRHLPPAEHPAFYASSRADAERDPARDGRDGLVPVGAAVRGGGLRRRDAQRLVGGARRVLRAGPRNPGRARPRTARRAALDLQRSPSSRAHRRRPRASARWPSTPRDRRARDCSRAGASRRRARGPAAGASIADGGLSMWGIIPAAGSGSRIQPLAFSKELLPVGSRLDGGIERPRAVSEYLVERMMHGGADKICFVISPGKSDIMRILRRRLRRRPAIAYVVQPRAERAVRRDLPRRAADRAGRAGDGRPARHDLVPGGRARARCPTTRCPSCSSRSSGPSSSTPWSATQDGRVLRNPGQAAATPRSNWIWGAFKMPGAVLHELHASVARAQRGDEYIGTLVNAWLADGGEARGRHGRRRLCRCRHAARLSRGDAAPRRRARGEVASDAQSRSAGPRPRCDGCTRSRERRDDADRDARRDEIRRRVAALGPWFHNIDLGGVQTAPDHFLGDYPGGQVAALRACAPGRSDRQDRARHRLQRRLLLDRDEAARRRARARHRLRRRLPGAGALRRRGDAGSTSSSASSRSTTSARSASASTSCCSWACSTTCAIRCWRST